MNSLTKSSLRYLFKHPWQFGLSILGIAIGVAIVVSIEIANFSSAKAFVLSINAVAGKATHQIIGTSEGIPDSFYTYLRIEKGYKNIAPVIESYVSLIDTNKKVFKLLGVDFFAERPFRDYSSGASASIDGELKDFLTKPNSIILSRESLNSLGKFIADTIAVLINGIERNLFIVGLITEDEQNKSALENLFITDIATAQELTNKIGVIDYIDVIVNTPAEEEELKNLLPEGFQLIKSGSRSQTAEQMIEAFDINLTSLSLLALIVGLFLIYNTMTFSVVQRKILIGTLRSIGVMSNEISKIILLEALIIGIIGTILGFTLAYFISKFLIVFISQTINDLYYVVSVREIYISPMIIIKGASLGIIATILSAIKPAKEASRVHPRSSMIRSEQESSLLKKVISMSIAGIVFIVVGVLVLIIPSKNIWLSYIGILPIIIGFALSTPVIIITFEKIFSPVYKKLFGITGKMASRSIIQNISRTYIAIAALALAVAATVGVGTMISNFRSTVINWLEARLKADIFISAPSLISRRNDTVLSEEILTKIKSLDGVKDINFYREIELFQEGKRYHIIATGLSKRSYSGFRFKEGNPDEVWNLFENGEILLSEPFAYKYDLNVGSVLSLKTDYGKKDFRVAGIYYDYASDQGLITINYDHFKKYWKTEGVSGISIFVDDGYSINEVKEKIQSLETNGQQLLVRTYKFLRDSSIEIFDRTFLIAKVLEILSVIVAFIGILSSLMSLQLERKRELGILRANGLLPSQLFKIVNLQTLIMGFTAGVLSLPLGNILAVILVYIINKRSFGWTMQFEILPSIMIEAMIVSLAAAFLAGIYPGIKMSRTSTANALRDE
ncbi:MAG: ABC transporter permease [Ignavibacterium sp.]|uniref:ABC transporter permease n=1 Tax=Ignavibacterium sp. TaxID=2651167 RepID=UPI00404BA0B4